jgi:hypothetical protein
VREDVAVDPDERTERATPTVARRPRGWASLYALAFVVLVGAGAALTLAAVRLLTSTRLLWMSTALSALAIALAIVSVVLPRSRH